MHFIDELCKIEGDKFIHLLTCQLIAFISSKILSVILNKYLAAILGFILAIVIGIIKELCDDHFDWDDIKADIVGAIMGELYHLI